MKHIHFIGICGTAMAPIANACKVLGWRVTGSDKGIFPPISEYLKVRGIEYYVGFHPERIGDPDLVAVGNFIGPSNPEFVSVRKRGLRYTSYPELLRQFLIQPESIVVAGTYGKTMTTALCAWIWETAGMHPSYMAAGILNNFSDGVRIADTKWSIVEGDEYPASRWNPVPKFTYYRPKYLLLTGVEWDHLDVYPAEEDYLNAFKNLIHSIPSDGMIVAAIERPNVNVLLDDADAAILHYNRKGEGQADWSLEIVARDGQGATLIFHGARGETIGPCQCAVFGDQNLDHFAGAVGLARGCGIPSPVIKDALETFKGVRRRMEIRGKVNGVTVVDDFAHSPAKVSATLKGLHLHFPRAKVVAVFEPNGGSRVATAKSMYAHAFENDDVMFIPRLSSTKTAEGEEARMDGGELVDVIREEGREAVYEPDDNALVIRIHQIVRPGDVVVFLGSHGFRGMIERTLIALESKN